MKSVSYAIAIILMLALLLGFGWLVYLTLKFLIAQFGVVNSQTSAILTIGTVTLLLSSIIVAAAIKALNVGDDKTIHPEKAAIYTRFVEVLEADDEEAAEVVDALKNYMMIWASNSVLKEFSSYYELVNNDDVDSSEVKDQAQKVITSIRQDVGKYNTNLGTTYIEKLLNS